MRKKVVLDTNIYISAIHFPDSVTRVILEKADNGEFQLVISRAIILEIRGVLRVKFAYDRVMLDLYESLLLSMCNLVEPKRKISFIKDDPEDNKILECAIEGEADIIVTGDKHLLSIGDYKGIKIVRAGELTRELR